MASGGTIQDFLTQRKEDEIKRILSLALFDLENGHYTALAYELLAAQKELIGLIQRG